MLSKAYLDSLSPEAYTEAVLLDKFSSSGTFTDDNGNIFMFNDFCFCRPSGIGTEPGPISTDYPEEIKIKGSDLIVKLDANGQVIPHKEKE